MNIVKVDLRGTATNLKHETKVVYDEGYLNLDRITSVRIIGSVARVIFSGIEGDYVEIDAKAWEKLYYVIF